jgi:hypothetical protein
LFIPDLDHDFLPTPDPGVKNASDPGSGSATLMAAAKILPQNTSWSCLKMGPRPARRVGLCLGMAKPGSLHICLVFQQFLL